MFQKIKKDKNIRILFLYLYLYKNMKKYIEIVKNMDI